MNNTLSLHMTVHQAQGNLISDMNGEMVMMNITSGKYYSLGRVGGRIWELAESPVSIRQIVNQLLQEYDVSEEICTTQVMGFLNMAVREGLILIQDQ